MTVLYCDLRPRMLVASSYAIRTPPRSVSVASCRPTLLPHVPRIRRGIAAKQVLRSKTRRIVAAMTHHATTTDRTYKRLVCRTVDVNPLVADADLTVTIAHTVPTPLPAPRRSDLTMGKKPFANASKHALTVANDRYHVKLHSTHATYQN